MDCGTPFDFYAKKAAQEMAIEKGGAKKPITFEQQMQEFRQVVADANFQLEWPKIIEAVHMCINLMDSGIVLTFHDFNVIGMIRLIAECLKRFDVFRYQFKGLHIIYELVNASTSECVQLAYVGLVPHIVQCVNASVEGICLKALEILQKVAGAGVVVRDYLLQQGVLTQIYHGMNTVPLSVKQQMLHLVYGLCACAPHASLSLCVVDDIMLLLRPLVMQQSEDISELNLLLQIVQLLVGMSFEQTRFMLLHTDFMRVIIGELMNMHSGIKQQVLHIVLKIINYGPQLQQLLLSFHTDKLLVQLLLYPFDDVRKMAMDAMQALFNTPYSYIMAQQVGINMDKLTMLLRYCHSGQPEKVRGILSSLYY